MLKSLEIGMVVNYLKLDSISIVGWSDGGLLDWKWAFQVNQNKERDRCNGAI
jgi:hypothetical protein